MIHAYDESYLNCARQSLALMLDFAVYGLDMELGNFYQRFLDSAWSNKFAAGDSRTLAGMSGIELGMKVMGIDDSSEENWEKIKTYEEGMHAGSREYWTGWALAYFQWESGMSFQQIEQVIMIEDIRSMYSPYHEMDIQKFCDRMMAYVKLMNKNQSLKRYRQYRNLSQSQLASLSGVPVRTIQQYEQGQKDINHCSAETLNRLSKALYCKMEDLLMIHVLEHLS